MPDLTMFLLAGYLVTGLVAGVLGGLIGIGGGVVVVPVLTLLFHKDAQLAVAASLFQMIFISTASAWRHYKNGYVLKSIVVRLVPSAVVAAVAGVLVGSSIPSWLLLRVFAVFLVYTSIDMGSRAVIRLIRRQAAREALSEFTPKNEWMIPAVAVPMGFACGVLGIGGGSLAVPALNKFLDLPVKSAIANSAAAIFFLSIVATVAKAASIDGMTVTGIDGALFTLHWYDPLILGGFLAPTSFIGGGLGARLAKIAPTRIIQIIFIVVMLYSAQDMWRKSQRLSTVAAPPAVETPAAPEAGL